MVAAYARAMVMLLSVLLLSWGTFANFTIAYGDTVLILSPPDSSSFVQGESIIFEGTEDDDLADLEWSSDTDGIIGTNSPLVTTSLSVGIHMITLTDIDEGGSSMISITITSPTCNGKTADEWESLGYTKFVGTSNDDVITGTNGDDIIVSLDGNDDIEALSGDDIICSGAGDDTIEASDGSNYIEGNNGIDNITTGAGEDIIFGGNGGDIIDAGDGNNQVYGNNGKDIITTGSGDDNIEGNNGNDCINSGSGTDTIDGGLGNNTINQGMCEVEPTNILICHLPPGNPQNQHAIKVSQSAVDAHLSHNDYLGACKDGGNNAAKEAYKKAEKEKSIKKLEIKEKRKEIKQIQNELKRLDKLSLSNEAIKDKLDTLIEEIKETLQELKEDYNYDREYKKELRTEFKEIKKAIIYKHNEAKNILKHKVDSKISQLTTSNQPKDLAKKLGLDYYHGKTKIAIKLSDINSEILTQLNSLGVVEAKNSQYIQLSVSLNDLPKLRSISQIENIRPPFPAVQFEEPLSEGVYFMNADLAQYAGITGKGIKVAVLDLGFQINSKIADNIVNIQSFRQTVDGIPIYGTPKESTHGTAVAEIITDVAPNVDLYLYIIESDIEFASAVDEAIEQGVNVIAMSAGWPNFPTDGTSHITKKIEEAVDHGIVFVVPAGNFGDKHWEGTFSDSNVNNWHDFSNSDEGLSIQITKSRIAENKPILAHLMWDVGLADVADFELVLVDPLGQIVDYSANEQKTKSDIPFEYIHHVPQIEGIYSLGVLYPDEISPSKMPEANIEIFTINDSLEYPISHSSVSVPADANGAIVVGAVNHLDGQLEPFSSQGPTNNGKLAPHVVGPDGVTTDALEGDPFYGTSATTPYVAGLAALILETHPNISPEQLLHEIQQNTESSRLSLEDEFDYGTGYGSASAIFLIENSEDLG